MSHLPPKIPPLSPIFPPHKFPSINTFFPSSNHHHQAQPSWVDEFLDFSSARRGAHRRSASDSIAFLETSFVEEEECGGSRSSSNHQFIISETNIGFDRLDDDQLMSMFSDDIVPPVLSESNPSTPSDQNSNNEEKPILNHHHQQLQQQPKLEPCEAEVSCKSDVPQSSATANSGDSIVDPKRVKRILANRQSAQRSRVRKLQYISELERSVTTLQTEVSTLSPRVAFFDHQRLILNVDNSALKQRIAALAQDKIFKDAHQEALKNEIQRLRQVYHQQNLKTNTPPQQAPSPSQQPPNSDTGECTDTEQVLNLEK